MKLPLWSRLLGVALGIFIGAGAVYAATYEYRVDVPSSLTVASEVVVDPGLQVSPTSVDFGEVAPGLSSGAVSINVTNIGDRGVSLYFDIVNLPSDMTLYVYCNSDGVWRECPHGYWYIYNPGVTQSFNFHISCLESVADAPYNFTIVIREGT